jgi:hypothetical protein
MTAAAVAALGVGAIPGTAVAAENLPPSQPVTAELKTGGADCVAGDARPFVRNRPVATAVLHDPDEASSQEVRLGGQFEAWWTDASGQEQRRTVDTEFKRGPDAAFQWALPDDVPSRATVSWRVRASDGSAWSRWSDEGAGSACQFVHDDEYPEPPEVTSADFPQDENWHDGVGRHTAFTVSSPSKDVVSYQYSFIRGPRSSVPADGLGGPAVVPHLATEAGVDTLTVQSVDRAGNYSAPTAYQFRVKSARGPVAQWKLGDPAGSRSAVAVTGPAARAGRGVAFGAPGPSGTELAKTAVLDGSGNGFLTPDAPVVRPATTFAVSAWVRPGRLDRNMAAVSQDSGASSLFTLGLRSDSGSSRWSFTAGGTQVGGGSPAVGRWARLTGIHDVVDGTVRLYVDGREVGSSRQTKPDSTAGELQIGRAKGAAGYRDGWQGGLGDVKVHDRVVPLVEAALDARRRPVSMGNWPLESSAGGFSPDLGDGPPLALRGGAGVSGTDPLNGAGHLELSGTGGYAATSRPVVDTGDSFTVAARVRLSDPVAPGRPMTVLSQGGRHADAFAVRYVPESASWQLVLTEEDRVGARERVAAQFASLEATTGDGDHLAVVYDRAAGEFRLYLDGDLADGATVSVPASWRSGGGLQVGRSGTGAGGGGHLKGAVDDVRAYSGALSREDVGVLAFGFGEPCFCG